MQSVAAAGRALGALPRIGGARAQSATKPTLACVPSQYGLFCEWPQRHSQVSVTRLTVRPVPLTTSNEPCTCSGPFFVGVTVNGPSRCASASEDFVGGSPVA